MLAARYYNDSLIALDELYAAAQKSSDALEVLRCFADELVRRAGDWRRLLDSRPAA